MTKKYFETPSITLVIVASNDIITMSENNNVGDKIPRSPDRQRSIWD